MNQSKETYIGPYAADAISGPETEYKGQKGEKGIIWEFYSCFHHGHRGCDITNNVKDPKYHTHTRERLETRTKNREEFLKSRGYLVVHIYWCEWEKEIEQDVQLQSFLEKRWPNRFPQNKPLKKHEIVKAIVDESYFAFFEVDVEIGKEWTDIVRNRSDFNEKVLVSNL